MLFNFSAMHKTGCISAGLGICISFGYNGKHVSI